MNKELSFEAMPFEFDSEFQGESFEWESESGGAQRSPQPRSGVSSVSTAGQRPGRSPASPPARPKKPPAGKPYGLVSQPGSERVRWVQDSLNRILGLRLPLDGIMRPEIRSAIRSFQKREQLPVSGIVGPDTERALLAATARTPTSEPAPASEPTPTSEPAPASELDELYFEAPPSTALPSTAPLYTCEQPLTSPLDTLDKMTCQLLCASMLAYADSYWPTDPKKYGLYYDKAGFIDTPPEKIEGRKRQAGSKRLIDACLIGTLKVPASGEKGVVLAFRGTEPPTFTSADWRNDFEPQLIRFTKIPGVRVHKGFNDSMESFEKLGIVQKIQARLKGNPRAKLYITGHSKGGALAFLAALLIKRNHPGIKVGVISFEAPRAGDTDFVNAYAQQNIPTLRYEFQDDIAPHLPPASAIISTAVGVLLAGTDLGKLYPKAARDFKDNPYGHVGTLRFIDWNNNKCGDSPGLQAARVGHLLRLPHRLVTERKTPADFHSIACGSGAWRAICKTDVCPSLISGLAEQKKSGSINRFP